LRVLLIDPGTLSNQKCEKKSLARFGEYRRDLDVSSLATAEIFCVRNTAAYAPRRSAIEKILKTMEEWQQLYPVSLGLLQLAAILRGNGIEVVYDNLEAIYMAGGYKDLEWLGGHLRPLLNGVDIVGITAMTPSINLALSVLKLCKEFSPGCTTIVGGPHATAEAESLLTIDSVDAVATGEADVSFLRFCQAISNGNATDIPGILQKHTGTRIGMAKHCDLSRVPQPAFDMIPASVRGMRPNYSLVMTERGCRFRCTYCVEARFFSHSVRFRPIEQVISEIRELSSRFGMDYFYFPDSSFDLDKDYTHQLATALGELDGISFVCNLKPGSCDRKLVEALLRAGFIGFYIGMESFDDDVLHRMRRPPYHVFKQTVEMMCASGVPVISGAVMVGFPGETTDTIQTTCERMLHLASTCKAAGSLFHVNPTVFTPYPGTLPYEQPKDYGLRIVVDNFDYFDRSTVVHELDTLDRRQILDGYQRLFETMMLAYS